MATQRDGIVKIKGGPNKWQIMLAVFDGQKVSFVWDESTEVQWTIHRLWPNEVHNCAMEILGFTFDNYSRAHGEFTAWVPHGPEKTMVHGGYNMESRSGYINLTPLCEIGALPWIIRT